MSHVWKRHLGPLITRGINMSPCLTAAPLLLEYIKNKITQSLASVMQASQHTTPRDPSDAGTVWISRAFSVPVEELLREAVLHAAGRGLLLDPALQQHLLVHLLLLLLLLQVLLHAETLPIELLVLLRRVPELRVENDASR